MSAIDHLFSYFGPPDGKALMPFVTAGDPDLEFTAAVLAELARRGAQPVRTGHSLQRSDRRRAGDPGFVHPGACDSKIKLAEILEMLRRADAVAASRRW